MNDGASNNRQEGSASAGPPGSDGDDEMSISDLFDEIAGEAITICEQLEEAAKHLESGNLDQVRSLLSRALDNAVGVSSALTELRDAVDEETPAY